MFLWLKINKFMFDIAIILIYDEKVKEKRFLFIFWINVNVKGDYYGKQSKKAFLEFCWKSLCVFLLLGSCLWLLNLMVGAGCRIRRDSSRLTVFGNGRYFVDFSTNFWNRFRSIEVQEDIVSSYLC